MMLIIESTAVKSCHPRGRYLIDLIQDPPAHPTKRISSFIQNNTKDLRVLCAALSLRLRFSDQKLFTTVQPC